MRSGVLAAYRVVTRLMPSEYMRRHRDAAIALLVRLLSDAEANGGWPGVLVVGWSAIVDAIVRLPAEHRRGRSAWSAVGMGRDLRYAVRSLMFRPLAGATSIATLALAIGLNAAVFSVLDWTLLRPLPYPAPSELIRVASAATGPTPGRSEVTYSEFRSLASAGPLRSSAAFSTATRILAGAGVEPVHVVLARISGDLFKTLGVYPSLGRGFEPREISSGAAVVVLSDALWRRRFGADAVAGRTVTIDGVPHAVVGVMPAGSAYPRDADVWRPVTAAEQEDDDRENVMIGRLHAGVSAARATSELQAIARTAKDSSRRVWAEDMKQTDARDVRLTLVVIFGSSALILLMACANVTALLGARSGERRAEMALRGALGASRGRLVRQLMTEYLVLAIAGGLLGVLVGHWALGYLVSLVPRVRPRAGEIVLDGRVSAFAFAVTLIVGLLIGVMPARQAGRVDPQTCLSAGGSARATRRTSGRLLVALQTALAIVLTVTAVLLARSLQHLVRIDDGFAADRLVAVDLDMRGGGRTDERELFRSLIAAAETLPGARSAAVAFLLPVRTIGPRVSIAVRGAERPAHPLPKVVIRIVSAGYFETTGIPIVEGRAFTERDTRTAPFVAIVNSAFVREVLSGRAPVGASLISELTGRPLAVVGVAGDISPAGEADRPALYVSCEQIRAGGAVLLVRTDGPPASLAPALAERLRGVAPGLARDRIYPVADVLARGRAVPRFSAQLASGFAVLALTLAALGVYGLVSSEIGARWRELAIRLALGSGRRSALWTVTRPAAGALAWGGAIGLVSAIAAARSMRALLHGVGPTDLPTLAAVPLVLGAVSAAAAGAAVLRVLRADPAATLRGN
jgi:putative ABC transport system permease protein